MGKFHGGVGSKHAYFTDLTDNIIDSRNQSDFSRATTGSPETAVWHRALLQVVFLPGCTVFL